MSRLTDNCAVKSRAENVLVIHDLPSGMYINHLEISVGIFVEYMVGARKSEVLWTVL